MAGQSATDFALFFCDLVDVRRDDLPLYLAPNVILDWFGRTVVGRERIAHYLSSQWPHTKHVINTAQPTAPIHHCIQAEHEDFATLMAFVGPAVPMEDDDDDCLRVTPNMKVPHSVVSDTLDSLSKLSLHAAPVIAPDMCYAPKAERRCSRWYFDNGKQSRNGGGMPMPLPPEPATYLEALGSLEFTSNDPSPSTAKTMKRFAGLRRKKERNFKLKLGYTRMSSGVQISMIIYYDSMSCRKKLAFTDLMDE